MVLHSGDHASPVNTKGVQVSRFGILNPVATLAAFGLRPNYYITARCLPNILQLPARRHQDVQPQWNATLAD
jgi:hypothetical protein